MSIEDYRPRFSFEITEEQKQRADKLLAFHGMRRGVFSTILDDVLDLLEKHGNMVIGIILDGQARPKEILPTLAQADKKCRGE